MNKTSYLIFFAMLNILGYSASSVHASVHTTPVKPTKENTIQHIIHDQEFQSFLSFFSTIFEQVKNLNYYTARGVVIPLPLLHQDIILNWKIPASGDMFMPFEKVNIQIKNRPTSFGDNYYEKMKELGLVIIQDKITNMLKTNTHNMDVSISPFGMFAIKLILLIKTTIEKPECAYRLKAEILRLLTKLSLTNDYTSTHIKELLTLLISQKTINLLHTQIPEGIDFISKAWSYLTSNQEFEMQKSLSCFLFRDASFAQEVHNFAASTEEFQWSDSVKNYINTHQHQVVRVQDFNTYPQAYVFVGELSVSHAINSLPEAVKEALNNANNSSHSFICSVNEHEHWLCRTSFSLDITDTIKSIAYLLVRTIRKYIQIRNELLTGNNSSAQAYQLSWDKQKKAIDTLQQFLHSKQGQQFYIEIQQKLQEIDKEYQNNIQGKNQEKKYQDQQKIIQEEEHRLIHNLKSIEQQIDMLQVGVSLGYTTDTVIQEDKHILENKAQLIKQALNHLQEKKEKEQPYEKNKEDLEKLQTQLNQLYALKEQQEKDGILPAENLLQAIEKTTTSITKLQNKQHQTINLNNRIAFKIEHQQAYANVYLEAAQNLEKKLTLHHEKLQNITTEQDRMIQEILFEQQHGIVISMIHHFKSLAQSYQDNVDTLQDLLKQRKTIEYLGETSLTVEHQQKIKDLHEKVMPIFADNQLITSFTNATLEYPELRMLVQDLQNSEIPELQDLQNTMKVGLQKIFHYSTDIRQNKRMCEFLIKRFAPGLIPLFNTFIYAS